LLFFYLKNEVIKNMATFIAIATSPNAGQAIFSDLSTVSYARTIYITVNGTPSATQTKSWTIAVGSIPSSSYTANFTGLEPSTLYTANCTVYRNSPWEKVYSNSHRFTTLAPPIFTWEWYTPKTEDNMLFPVTVKEWLDFCERINQMRVARGLGEYIFTKNIWSNMPFSKDIFLEAVEALTPFRGLSPELSQVKSMIEDKWGESSKIKPWYFSNLKSCLNQAIVDIPK
jgi:hypothetical protein